MQIPRQYVDLALFYSCGICGCYHPVGFDGDCREDDSRFAAGELDEQFGVDGWAEVAE